MTTIQAQSASQAATLPQADGLRLAFAAARDADGDVPTPRAGRLASSLPSDRTVVLPPTLERTPQGFGVSPSALTDSQTRLYERLLNSGLTAEQVNEIVTIIVRGGVDGLAAKYSDLSVDNLACLSQLINNLDSTAAVHDASHMLLGNRKKLAYGVPEYAENMGNALGNVFLNIPHGLYERLKVSTDADGRVTVVADEKARAKIHEVFGKMEGNSRLIDSYFLRNFRANSKGRVAEAVDTVIDIHSGSFDVRFARFYGELQKHGQVPVGGNAELTASLKKAYQRLESSVAGQTESPLRSQILERECALVTEILAQSATTVFKSLPDSKRFEFFVDHIAMVLALHAQAPNQITVPTEKTHALFKGEWTSQASTATDPVTGASPLTQPGFLRKFFEARNQLRAAMGIPTAPVALPAPSTAAAPTSDRPAPQARQPGGEGQGTTTGTTTTTAAEGRDKPRANPDAGTQAKNPTPTPTPKQPKSDGGGYVQRPDAPPEPEIEKPMTTPLVPAKKGGPVHPPSKKPEVDKREGLYTSPRPEPGKVEHTGDTSPRPKFDPNTPPFPDVSKVPESRIPNKLPNTGKAGKAAKASVAQTRRRTVTAPVKQAAESPVTWSKAKLPRQQPKTASAATEFSWSSTRLRPGPNIEFTSTFTPPRGVELKPATTPATRTQRAASTSATARQQPNPVANNKGPTAVTAAKPAAPIAQPSAVTPQQRLATLQQQLKAMQNQINQLPQNAAPTLAQAQAVMAQMEVQMKVITTEAAQIIQALPAHLQGFATAQLEQLQAAWDRWSPGALKNLEAFGKGAGDALVWVLSLLGALGTVLDTMQKIGG